MALFKLPTEIIDLLAEQLEFLDLLKFGSTCLRFRNLFVIDKLVWLLQNFPAHNDATIRDDYIQKLHFVSRSYLLLCLFRCNGVYGLDILIKNGASFKHVQYGELLEEKFRKFGHCRDVDFLLQHGASLRDVPCGTTGRPQRTALVILSKVPFRSLLRSPSI